MKTINYKLLIPNKLSECWLSSVFIFSLKAISYKLKADERGSAIYLALFTLSAILATALAVSTVAVGELKISKEVVNSMQAVDVADSAIEYTMMEVRKNPESSLYNDGAGTTALDANLCEYQMHFAGQTFNTGGIKCSADVNNDVAPGTHSNCSQSIADLGVDCTRIEARGSFGNTNRAMEIVFPNL